MIKADRWRPSDGMQLEPNALRAAREAVHSLAVTAGPGAGKTELLAQRADFLLRTGTSPYPQRILAIAFKVDASRNLKDRIRRRCGSELAARLDSYTFHAFSKRLIDRFRLVLTGKDALDVDYTIGTQRVQRRQIEFADMVPLAIQILQNSLVARNAVQQTYSHVFLDEFQDCTGDQYQLIREAFLNTGIPLTAVGDTKQKIMGWAGALDGVFLTFAQDFNAQAVTLYQNFRSEPLLRRMQNAMVKRMDPAAAVLDADLVGAGGSIQLGSFAADQLEAEALADRIQQLMAQGHAASEIAVLVSRQPDLYARPLMDELQRRGVMFRNEQSLQDLAAEPLAQLIVDFLLVVVGDSEPDAYGRLMNVLLATGIDEDAAYALRAGWHRFIDEEREQVFDQGEGALNAQALKQLGDKFLSKVGLDNLVGLSADYEHGPRMIELIDQTYERLDELLRLDARPAKALARFSDDRAVRIMTIHKSKGLEFDTVIMLGVEDQTYWGDPAEQRSAFFVGISRAKSQLLLTTADQRARPQGFNGNWRVQRTPHGEFLGYAKAVL
ncbi:MAG: ATP-dependent helicase [Burkholderiales bacterium]|jgi:superfamily I DNA/RNA helicase|nr:MAG: ATP-dependent helicase [Burkholderiales bacterium]